MEAEKVKSEMKDDVQYGTLSDNSRSNEDSTKQTNIPDNVFIQQLAEAFRL